MNKRIRGSLKNNHVNDAAPSIHVCTSDCSIHIYIHHQKRPTPTTYTPIMPTWFHYLNCLSINVWIFHNRLYYIHANGQHFLRESSEEFQSFFLFGHCVDSPPLEIHQVRHETNNAHKHVYIMCRMNIAMWRRVQMLWGADSLHTMQQLRSPDWLR